MLPLILMMWTACRSQVLLHGTKHTRLVQETEKVKKDPGEGGAVTGLATASPRPGEPAGGDNVPVVPNGSSFTFTFRTPTGTSLWPNVMGKENSGKCGLAQSS